MFKKLRAFFGGIFRLIRNFFFLIGLIVVASIVYVYYEFTFLPLIEEKIHSRDVVLVYNLDGPLSERTSENSFRDLLVGFSPSLRDLIQVLDHGSRNERVKGIVVRLDHARLGYAQVQELQAALRRFRSQGKFALAHADTFGELEPGMSAYYFASAFDEISVQPVGSLNITGLGIEVPFVRKLLDEQDLHPRFDQRKEYKSILETFTQKEMTEESYEATKALLDSILDQVIQDISKEREIPETELREIINAAPLVDAQKAKKLGLIDHSVYFEETIERAKNLAKSKDLHFMPLVEYLPRIVPQIVSQSRIAVIYGVGTIKRTASRQDNPLFAEETLGSEETRMAFKEALEDPKVKAIVFRINSPGGSAVASETIAHQVEVARNKGIPVVVSMGDYAGSGGYWIAAPATKIVAHPATITGSIGVAGGKLVLGDFWKKWGVNWGKVTAGKNAVMSSPNFDYDLEQWEKLQESLDFIYETFVTKVSEGRNLPREHVLQVAKGRIWSGSDALKYGLVDRLGDLNDAIQLAREEAKILDGEETLVLTYPRRKTNFERLLELTRGNAFEQFLPKISANSENNPLWEFFRSFKTLHRALTPDVLSMPPVQVKG